MFADRIDAGKALAAALGARAGVVVVGLPRGGVPVAAVVAEMLRAPLDVIVVRKLGVPSQPELAMGAIGEGGVRVLNPQVLRDAHVTEVQLQHVEEHERHELARRADRFRGGRRRVPLAGRPVIVVDDGIATGATARAACEVIRAEGATRIVLAAPVAPTDTESRLAGVADEFVFVATPRPFGGVGRFYDDFRQTTDEEVTSFLRAADARTADQEIGGAAPR